MEDPQNNDKTSTLRIVITVMIVVAIVIYAKFFWK